LNSWWQPQASAAKLNEPVSSGDEKLMSQQMHIALVLLLIERNE